MGAVFNRRILRRQAKGIPAHRMQHVETLCPFIAGDHIAQRIIADMAHMNAPGRVGEHLQHVIFGPAAVFLYGEDLLVRPLLLPVAFSFLGVISRHQCSLVFL